jgi:hypothetical protein
MAGWSPRVALAARGGCRVYDGAGSRRVPKRPKKAFFFEKKKQKTFALGCPTSRILCHLTHNQQTKVFWFFFSKKNPFFLSYQWPPEISASAQ